jgi:hypothetical protein
MPTKDFAMKDFWPIYWKIKGRDAWRDHSFDADKAYLCCMLAELAYMHIKQHEIDQWNRIKIFPCATLEAVAGAGPFQITQATLAVIPGEHPEIVIHIVETQNFISVVVMLDEVIFIASRGTAEAYDHRINFTCWRESPLLGLRDVRMHRGFLTEALRHARLIADKIELAKAQKQPAIYVAGHSLGGALAAQSLDGVGCGEGDLAWR